jgi:hypothetical protein
VFRPDPTLTHVTVTREQVVTLLESINQPQISIPGKPPQPAQAHLCGLRVGSGGIAVLVALYLADTGENVVYVREGQASAADFAPAEAEGRHFLESMGFMLDNVNFRNLSPQVQEQTLKRIPLFSPPRPPGEVPTSPVAARPAGPDPARLARLLASF